MRSPNEPTDDKRQSLEKQLSVVTEQRYSLEVALKQSQEDYFELLGTSSKTKTKGYDLPWIDFAR